MSRKIELRLSPEWQEATMHVSIVETRAAIGYLAMWGGGSARYCNLLVFGDKDGNLSAIYTNDNGEQTYALFGHLHKANDGSMCYSFHS